jgi:hypothetical protein
MEPQQMVKQMVDFNRSAFDNGFNAMVMVQDQAEDMLHKFMERSPWLPKEGEKLLNDWITMCKRGRDDYKKIVEENFNRAESFFVEVERPEVVNLAVAE